ncbi:zinc finger B-box domain-containing protein 1 isoform X2 [Anomaloglossus baeobatrachus]|uniref:zinc finger B-box domain-containing protein 1 isoform X2 n=1 Tax=Anomaloglossus baeobatrachus TaxID=238106 RepID=UPI003F4FA892
MSGDFVIVPPAKSGNTVRLKARNIRELRKETLQLERQNQEMEQKLNQLRQSMSREKEERERSNPYHWISGHAGNQRPDKESAGKFSAGKIKLKVLQNPIAEPEKPKTLTRTNIPAAEKPRLRGKTCGQCESKSALLMCLECGEDYCTACFTRFHQKGALKLHRTLPIQEKSQDVKLDISHDFKKEQNVDEESGKPIKDNEIIGSINSTRIPLINKTQGDSGKSFISEPRKAYLPGSLLHGTFNEEESAKYFNEALLEWRNEAKNKSQHVNEPDGTGSTAVQTVVTTIAQPLHIEFKENSLSYMEKLMLKRHRRTSVSQVPHNYLEEVRYSPTVSENELDKCSDLTAEEMEAHENYVALFRAGEHVRSDVIHEPALKIVELDKDPEEKLDECRSFVVRETENKEMKSRRLSGPAIKSSLSARDSLKLPQRASDTQRIVPVGTPYSVEGSVVEFTSWTASHSQDSKSMKYKSFKDSQSLDTALMVNVPQNLQSAVFRQQNRVSAYQGLEGFFMLDIDPVEGKAENCPLQTPDLTSAVEEVTYTGNNYWRPESSLSVYADDAVVKDLVENAWSESNDHILEHSLTARNVTHTTTTASPFRRSHSSMSSHRISGSDSSPRPSSAVARPMSRAASEISEIESIDSADGQDYLFEDENRRETLAVLEKEFHSLNSDNRKLQTSALNYDSIRLTRHGQRLAKSEDEVPISRLSLHTLQSCAVESESDEEETLQDKLNVLSLQ